MLHNNRLWGKNNNEDGYDEGVSDDDFDYDYDYDYDDDKDNNGA